MKFNFRVERKVTTWIVDSYEVTANTPVAAEERMMEEFWNPEFWDASNGVKYIGSEELDDTQDDMTPQENGGAFTKELVREDEEGEQTRIATNEGT
jgi:hypothetical protein